MGLSWSSESSEKSVEKQNEPRKPVRVWADGCFDMMHYGHANALRQAKELGSCLVVGVHSDEDILKHKGPPLVKEEERYKAVEACKWVDEVVRGAPYVTEVNVLDEHNIDFCVHGEDITTSADGVDTYDEVKKAGKYKTIKRTEGVSTTDILGRILSMTRDHFSHSDSVAHAMGEQKSPYSGSCAEFIPSTRKIVQFASTSTPNPDDVVVYVDGGFDLFHVGHIEMLKKAREMGDYLIVGVHSDDVVNERRGENHPIMNTLERVLSVMQCKYVNEVIIGAPWIVTEELMQQLRISIVVSGSHADCEEDAEICYEVPMKTGKHKQIVSEYFDLTTPSIIQRILENRLQYAERNKKKEAREVSYIEQK